jgi:signal transduction histidine kinase
MFTMDDIGSKVFFVQVSLESSLNGKYVQVKRQAYTEKNIQVLQMIDISAQIMYDIADGEKNLLALINATVSHEMRNPTNSIYS